jgi:integrase
MVGSRLLFSASGGGPLTESNWKRSVGWREAVAAIGRPELRVHDLRHTAASVWLGSGADPLVVADDGRSGAQWAHGSDVEASDRKDADVVCIRAIEK